MHGVVARHRPIVISFSGLDGAGKSTQINHLSLWLAARGMRVHHLSFWDDVAVWRRFRENIGHTLFRGDKGVGTPERPVARRDKNVQSRLMFPVRIALILLDTLGLARVWQKLKREDGDIVIFDRYIYDQIANLYGSSATARAIVRGLLRLVPRPDLAFLVDAEPKDARARKPEYPLDFLETIRARYLALSKLAGLEVIPPASQEETADRIAQRLNDSLLTSAENDDRLINSPVRQAEFIDYH